MSINRHFFDLASRYHNHPYDANSVYVGEHSADKELTVEIEYDRPYFNAPPINGSFGNPISFINLVKDFLKQQKFHYESNEVLDIFLKQKPLVNSEHFSMIDVSAHFVDFENHLKKVEIDDEIFCTLKKLTANMSQLPEFMNITSSQIDKLISKDYDFSTTNIYGRNILSYINDPIVLEKTLAHIDTLEDKFSILFNMDNFNSGPISQHTDLKSFGLLLKSMNSIDKELAYKFFFYENKFSINASGKFLHCMDVFFSPLNDPKSSLANTNIQKMAMNFIEDLSLAVHEISEFDSDFSNKVLHLYSEHVKNSEFKGIKNTNEIKILKATLLQLDYFLLREDNDLKINSNAKVQKMKI